MFAPAPHLELPRRITAYYLLFGLAAIAWLTVGAVIVAQSIQSMRAESSALTQLGKTAATITADHARNGQANFQAIVERIAVENGLRYCAIVGPDGRYLAHSNPKLAG
jgi:sensor histidine kinase regulating citrate/malate metabolism